MFREEDIDIERQFDSYRLWINGNPENDRYWHHQAQEDQALLVTDALRDLMGAGVTYSARVDAGTPLTHLRFGVARRAKALWVALRGLHAHVSPDRVAPMNHDEVEDVSRDLNVIYINIRGLLDNLAWAVVHQFGTDATKQIAPVQIGLFRRTLSQDDNLKPLAETLAEYQQWDRDISARRDPAAHRIPLSVAPSVLDEAAQVEWNRLKAEYDAVFADALVAARDRHADVDQSFARVSEAHARLQSVGRFLPWFGHDYAERQNPIYPTVPQDLAMMLKVSARVFAFMDERLAA